MTEMAPRGGEKPQTREPSDRAPSDFPQPQNGCSAVARPRQPTELLELKGAYQKDPQRKRPPAPRSLHGLGNPPSHFKDDEIEVWREIVGNAPDRVLTAGDRLTVEMVARLVAKFRADWLTGAEFGTLKSCLTELGWTPASRSKITTLPEDDAPAGEFSAFVN